MSDGSKIYDVSSLDSRYVCDKSGAIFALDDDTFLLLNGLRALIRIIQC